MENRNGEQVLQIQFYAFHRSMLCSFICGERDAGQLILYVL